MNKYVSDHILAEWGDSITICKAIHYPDQSFVIKLISRHTSTKKPSCVRFEYGTLADHAAHFAEWRKSKLEIFLMLAITDGQGHSSENVQATWALAIDRDTDIDIDAFERSPFKPTLAIKTSEGRYHLIWVLDAPLPKSEALPILIALAIRFNADRIFANVTQAVRLPGFVNGKYGTEVELLAWSDESRTYRVEDLGLAFDTDLALNSIRMRQPRLAADMTLKKDAVSKEEIIRDLKSALDAIPADDYGIWIRIGMALSRPSLDNDGYGLWDSWSQKSSKYDATEMLSKWKSFQGSHSISLATVFALAVANGWHNPGFRNKANHVPDDQQSERAAGRLLADEMRDQYAAVLNDGRSRQTYLLLRWDGQKYLVLNDIERRKAIESYVRKVRQANPDNKDWVRFLSLKSANNRALDDLSEHICEHLVDNSTACATTEFPYFPVENGVLNLLSRELVPPSFRPLSMISGGVMFDPSAKAELFTKTLNEIFEGDEEMVRAVIRLFGYILLGTPKEHILVVFFGPTGRNGKTLIVQVVREIFGDYAQAIPSSVILAKSHNNEGPTPALAKLYRKRLAIISEPSPKHPLDAGFIKLMTGGEHITARPMHGQLLEFVPEFTPIIIANKIPSAPDDDPAFWRRVKIVKFSRTFSDEEIDPDLKEKLTKEKSGILNLLLDGIQDYLTNGLNFPDKIKSAGIDQRKEFDPFEAWHEECAIETDNATETPLHALAASYDAWANINRQFRRMSKKELSAKLVGRGYVKVDRRRYPHFCGIMLRDISTP